MTRASRFTPWLTPRPELEAMFVARQAQLNDLVNRARRASHGPQRDHALLVGPRGAGKTHLLTMAYHRLRDLRDEGVRLQLARIPEDPWTIVSYRHLLMSILASLGETNPPWDEDLLELSLIEHYAKDGLIVVLLENLGDILAQIKESGQERLRHFLQTDPSLLLLASTPLVDRALASPASPFYRYFSPVALPPLTNGEIESLIRHIAQARGDEALLKILGEPRTSLCLDAVRRLAGAQPRFWVVFGQLLGADSVRRIEEVVVESFDDLTAYYQDRLRGLSSQQRQVVAKMAGVDHALNNKELASELGIPATSVARTIGELCESGWVQRVESPWDLLIDKRRRYYELAEPLLGLAFQPKDCAGEPLRLSLDFLCRWYDPGRVAGTDQEPVRLGLRGARGADVDLLALIDDALSQLSSGDTEAVMALPSVVRTALVDSWVPVRAAISPEEPGGVPPDVMGPVMHLRYEVHNLAFDLLEDLPQEPRGSRWIARAEDLANRADGEPQALSIWLRWLSQASRAEEARSVADLVNSRPTSFAGAQSRPYKSLV